MKKLDRNNKRLCNQFANIQWIDESGESTQQVKERFFSIIENSKAIPKCIVKAKRGRARL